MASDRLSPHNNHIPHSIPLQDLTRPPDPSQEDDVRDLRARSLHGRARNLLAKRQSFSGRSYAASRYERVAEGSPPAQSRSRTDLPHVTTPRAVRQKPYYEDGNISLVEVADQAAFQAAVGSVGLNFDAPEPSRPPVPSYGSIRSQTQSGIATESDGPSPDSQSPRQVYNEGEDYYFQTDSDSTPLADARYQSPIDGVRDPADTGQPFEHDDAGSSKRRKKSMGARLGDDLPNLEAGYRGPGASSLRRLSSHSTRSATRSLSISAASTPLSRAGSVVRKMSQRVVNLSNEPEIEQSFRREASFKEARLDRPPSFPAIIDFAQEEQRRPSSPIEKTSPLVFSGTAFDHREQYINPLKGKSLGIFSSDNWIRLKLCEMLVHPLTEPIILLFIVLQTILLAIDSASRMPYLERPIGWGSSRAWLDYAMLALFVVYTLEIVARVIVSGFIRNAKEYSTVDRELGAVNALLQKIRKLFAPEKQQSTVKATDSGGPQPSILRSFTSVQAQVDQPGHTRQQQRVRLARRAFCRHSFNRLDFLAVTSFWISFALAIVDIESRKHIYVFRMLSCLRILRLLGLTSGTSVILRSLKKAAPMLVNVAFLIGFFWLLFAIIGVQSFKSSLRRTCVWYDTMENIRTNNYTQNVAPASIQFCGGHLDAITGLPQPWLTADLQPVLQPHKGYLCPQKSLCIEGGNPYNGTVSFDDVLHSLELVFVIMSSNTFSDLLYYTTDSDYLASALFFTFGTLIMSFWLMNLLVAVITSSFQVIREESKASAFTAEEQIQPVIDEDRPRKTSPLKRAYGWTYWLWIVIICFSLVVQALRSANMGPKRERFVNTTETIVTLTLVLEIILRFITDWRNFHKSTHNWVDLGLATITAVIQIPPLHRSGQVYAWMTFFQILRIYRVVLAVSLTRDLIVRVLGNASGLLNLIVFVFLITFLCAIFAVQVFRGEFPLVDISGAMIHVTFNDIYNSFIGMYQVLSSENWTILMYNATQYDLQWSTSWYGATFFVLWFILANFIVLNMFIAVIQENFDVTEDEKRLEQVKAFLQQKELGGPSHGNLSLSTIFRLGRHKRQKDPLDYGPATMEMLMKDAVVRDFLDEQMAPLDNANTIDIVPNGRAMREMEPGVLLPLWSKIVGLIRNREPNPFYSRLQFSQPYKQLDPRTMAKEVVSATEQRKRAQRQYLQEHPTYNVSLFIFTPRNPIRKFCQCIVGPGRGNQRIEGVDPVKPIWYAFSALIYAAIVAMVLLACVTTPLYQREYFSSHGYNVRNWFLWTDMAFAAIFGLEAAIKIIADGFFWTPNAYFRGSWGFIDGLVLVTLWVNVGTSLYSDGGVSRAVGAFKALRALRLLNVSDSARDTFHSVIILGGWKVVSAAFVSLSLLVPFAIFGLNLFNGQMRGCNDLTTPIKSLADCVGEWQSSPYLWNVLAPRQVANPYYSFDDFGSSLSILFQIVSQEGWIDVMWTAMEASGRGQQPQPYASQGNAVFFIIFNLLGAVFVLTLFVSVFMRNYTEQTGVAFLTADQRSWLELRKLLRQISPSKRPSNQTNQTNQTNQRWRSWCYKIAVKKHGKWQRFVTAILLLHLILLVIEFYPEVRWWERARDYIFLALTVFYIANIVVRICGLTWKRFRNSSWDLYSLVSVSGTLVTTILALSRYNNQTYGQLHKLFLVSIALLLIPRNNQLDQLFKTAAASLTTIANLLATWLVLFLVYAIALTQTFGLTRFGKLESDNLNFRNVPKAMVLLFRMSCGEGWNQIMEDYANITYPNCVEAKSFFDSDCGSAAWARALFISWNILSMYIFVSLFVSLIFESFSYVYQRSSGLSAVSREEVRRFKQAWATWDPEGTGYISKEAFPRLLGELSGVFEMRIYDGEHSVYGILENCLEDTRGSDSPAGVVHGVNIAKLNERISTINVKEIRRRRARMDIFYQEVLVNADPSRGINFTSCLMILAHYNVIMDSKSMQLEEFLRRRARLQRVEEEVNRRIVIGFFDTMYWSRRFRRRRDLRQSAHMMTVPSFGIPEILVEDEDATPRTEQFPSMSIGGLPVDRGDDHGLGTGSFSAFDDGFRRRSNSGTASRASNSYNGSPQLTPPIRISPSDDAHSPWRFDGADAHPSTADSASRSRAVSAVDRQNALQVFDNSAWGESIRRSFTMGRSAARGRGRGSSHG